MPSAKASQAIFPGAAVAQSADKASLAGSGLLATHIATTGAGVGGIVTMVASGVVSLNNWFLSAGVQYLTPGQTYYVGSSGKLITTVNSQPIGIATSKTDLSVTIQSQLVATASNNPAIAGLQSQINALAAQLDSIEAGTGVSGTFPIPNGVDNATVTLSISDFFPTFVICSVRKPANGLQLFACVVDGTLSQTAFTFYLNGVTDQVGYKLDYRVF
jgi:hypothetical protein